MIFTVDSFVIRRHILFVEPKSPLFLLVPYSFYEDSVHILCKFIQSVNLSFFCKLCFLCLKWLNVVLKNKIKLESWYFDAMCCGIVIWNFYSLHLSTFGMTYCYSFSLTIIFNLDMMPLIINQFPPSFLFLKTPKINLNLIIQWIHY